MSELFKIRQHAGPGTRFGPEAFASMIGEVVPVTLPSEAVVNAVLMAASVCDEGAYAELILEVPDGTLPPAALAKYGIGRQVSLWNSRTSTRRTRSWPTTNSRILIAPAGSAPSARSTRVRCAARPVIRMLMN